MVDTAKHDAVSDIHLIIEKPSLKKNILDIYNRQNTLKGVFRVWIDICQLDRQLSKQIDIQEDGKLDRYQIKK